MQVITLVNLEMLTKEHCQIQTNDFEGATIGKGVMISNAGSGENFCGTAGTTSGGSTYKNMASSDSSSSAMSSSASSAGTSAASHAHKTAHKVAHKVAHKAIHKVANTHKAHSGCAWGPGACGMQLILLL